MPIVAANPFGAYVAGRQARQDDDYSQNRNALAQMELQNAPAEMQQRNQLVSQQIQQGQQQIDATKAKDGYTRLAQALSSGNPKQYVLQREPEFVAAAKSKGFDIASLDDQQAAQVIDGFARQYAGAAGIAPAAPEKPESYTLSPGQQRYEGDRMVASAPERGMDEYQRQTLDLKRRELEQGKRMTPYQQAQIDIEQKKLAAKQNPQPSQAATDQKLDAGMNTLSAIRDVKEQIGLNTAGPLGQVLRNVGGTDAADMESNIDTIKANIGFDRLQMMRDASKTGGALGGIAVQELNLLQSTIASLNTKQSPAQLRRNLEKVEAQYTKSVNAYRAAKGLPPLPTEEQPQQQTAQAPKRVKVDAQGNVIGN